MSRLFWIAVSSLCYAASLACDIRADAEGLRHTDAPCERCRRDPWEQRRIDSMRRARPIVIVKERA